MSDGKRRIATPPRAARNDSEKMGAERGRKTCPICGKEFRGRCNAQRYCSRDCTYASQRKENSELRVKREKPAQSETLVKIKILKKIPLYPELVPQYGCVYDARRCDGGNVEPFYIIPDLGGKKIVVRNDECVEVAE